jgi:hypothetical protein
VKSGLGVQECLFLGTARPLDEAHAYLHMPMCMTRIIANGLTGAELITNETGSHYGDAY